MLPKDNPESWQRIHKFVEKYPDDALSAKWKQMARVILSRLDERGLVPLFRIGQSMSHVILSTADRHELTFEPRITLEFHPSEDLIRIAYGHTNLWFSEPLTEERVAVSAALPRLLHYLRRLWSETKLNTPIPGLLNRSTLVAFLVGQGNRALRFNRAVPLERLDNHVFSGTPAERALRWWPPEASTPVSFHHWLEDARPERLVAVRRARLVPEAGAVAVTSDAGARVEPPVLAGDPGLLLAAERNGAYEVYEATLSFPPRTDLGLDDVGAFVETCPDAEAIKKYALFWNSHIVHWTKCDDWAGFLDSVTDQHCPRLVDALDNFMSSKRTSSAGRGAWRTLVDAHGNPEFGPLYDFHYRDTRPSLPPHEDVDAMRTKLRTALDAVIAFAKKEQLGNWPDYFAAARAMLDAPVSDPVTGELFGNCDLPLPAMQLLAAAFNADAFGLTGSWDDQCPEDSAGYQRCSEALHRRLLPSIEAAIDAGAEPERGRPLTPRG